MSIIVFIPETEKHSARHATMLQPQARALHVLELQLDLASPDNLKAMHQYALEQATDFTKRPRQRATWKRISALIKAEMKP